MILSNGKPQLLSREFEGGKFIETVQTVTELDEQAIINRKIQLQGRQAQIKQQAEQLKVVYDQMTADMAECDTMLTQFTPIGIDIPT